ncbi:MAG: trehalose-phosphatase [Bacillota bacterium]
MNKKYLLNDKRVKKLKKKIKTAENIFLFLDYDGTLAPFCENPADADVFPGITEELLRIKQKPGIYISLISGRELSNLKSMFYLEGINYAGSHGMEIEFSFLEQVIYPVYKKNELRSVFNKIFSNLKEEINENIRIEDKGFAAAFHYNNDREKALLEKKLKTELEKFSSANLEIISGRQVAEIRPTGWHKGRAVNFIADKLKEQYNLNSSYNIYLGDDRTDEDAFKMVEDGLSIYVQNNGDLKTSAEYYLHNPEEVYWFLKNLL